MEQHWTYPPPQASPQGEEEENGDAGEIQHYIPPRQDQIQPQGRVTEAPTGKGSPAITSPQEEDALWADMGAGMGWK